MSQTEETLNQTEEIDEPEEIIEKKPRKKMTFTPEQLEKKRLSLQKARDIRNSKIKSQDEEIKKLKEEAKPTVVEKKKKQIIIKEVVKEEYESDEESEPEIVERVIVKKVPRPKAALAEPSKNDMINLTYRERLQEQLKNEKMKILMNSLFDY